MGILAQEAFSTVFLLAAPISSAAAFFSRLQILLRFLTCQQVTFLATGGWTSCARAPPGWFPRRLCKSWVHKQSRPRFLRSGLSLRVILSDRTLQVRPWLHHRTAHVRAGEREQRFPLSLHGHLPCCEKYEPQDVFLIVKEFWENALVKYQSCCPDLPLAGCRRLLCQKQDSERGAEREEASHLLANSCV